MYRRNIKLEYWQNVAILIIIWDFITLHLSYFLALWLRFDAAYSHIPENYLHSYLHFITLYSVGAIIIFACLRMYIFDWSDVSFRELIRTTTGSLIASVLHSILIVMFFMRMPLSYYIFGAFLQLVFVIIPRFFYRFILFILELVKRTIVPVGRVMIIGDDQTTNIILADLWETHNNEEKVVCIIDENPNKWGRFIDGIPVVGGIEDVMLNVKKFHVQKIYLAIPDISDEDKTSILDVCEKTGCKCKQIPDKDLNSAEHGIIRYFKDFTLKDLIGHIPIQTVTNEVSDFFHGKRVLVTGGGGSVGSELCRQIAANNPEQLLIFEVCESSAYSIQSELREKYPEINLVTIIGSVRDSRRIYDVFKTFCPHIVFHAALHKHVPLIESNPCEAIKNNAIGTYNTAYAAMVNGCESFVLISSDKAVSPTNIMGASLNLCEKIIQSFETKIKDHEAEKLPSYFPAINMMPTEESDEAFRNARTMFMAVRFGNLLGTNNSVMRVFQKQIEEGKPVTVTHRDMIRYFMTVTEAVTLILQASTYAKGGEIFVLDMGTPVKIIDLARNLIRLNGYIPDEDIEIVITGLRPGEKLYEEMLMAYDNLTKTENDRIFLSKTLPFNADEFCPVMNNLMEISKNNCEGQMREAITSVISTYNPKN